MSNTSENELRLWRHGKNVGHDATEAELEDWIKDESVFPSTVVNSFPTALPHWCLPISLLFLSYLFSSPLPLFHSLVIIEGKV